MIAPLLRLIFRRISSLSPYGILLSIRCTRALFIAVLPKIILRWHEASGAEIISEGLLLQPNQSGRPLQILLHSVRYRNQHGLHELRPRRGLQERRQRRLVVQAIGEQSPRRPISAANARIAVEGMRIGNNPPGSTFRSRATASRRCSRTISSGSLMSARKIAVETRS